MKTEVEWLDLYAAREKATYPFPVAPGWLFKEIEAETLRDVLKLFKAGGDAEMIQNALKRGLELLERGRRDDLKGCPCPFYLPLLPGLFLRQSNIIRWLHPLRVPRQPGTEGQPRRHPRGLHRRASSRICAARNRITLNLGTVSSGPSGCPPRVADGKGYC